MKFTLRCTTYILSLIHKLGLRLATDIKDSYPDSAVPFDGSLRSIVHIRIRIAIHPDMRTSTHTPRVLVAREIRTKTLNSC